VLGLVRLAQEDVQGAQGRALSRRGADANSQA
jgi:hypothetical protein